MALSKRCIWYLVLVGVEIYTFVVTLITKGFKFLYDFPIYLVVAGFLYFGYMLIIELAASGENTQGAEKLVNENNSNFMANQFFKFLFCSIIGINFILSFFSNEGSPSIFYIICLYGIYYLLPVACFLEIYFKERERKPNLIRDLIVILIILGLKLLCKFLEEGSFDAILKGILEFILNFVCMISAYIVYDVLVYFKINGSFNGYTIKGLYEMAKENSEKTTEGA